MTENELRKLTPAERAAHRDHVLMRALLTTHEEACDLLSLEGWQFMGSCSPEDEDGEVWRRQVGGRVKWCELSPICIIPPELPPEQCWHRAFWSCDPRLIEV